MRDVRFDEWTLATACIDFLYFFFYFFLFFFVFFFFGWFGRPCTVVSEVGKFPAVRTTNIIIELLRQLLVVS